MRDRFYDWLDDWLRARYDRRKRSRRFWGLAIRIGWFLRIAMVDAHDFYGLTAEDAPGPWPMTCAEAWSISEVLMPRWMELP